MYKYRRMELVQLFKLHVLRPLGDNFRTLVSCVFQHHPRPTACTVTQSGWSCCLSHKTQTAIVVYGIAVAIPFTFLSFDACRWLLCCCCFRQLGRDASGGGCGGRFQRDGVAGHQL